ncbi:hypothetical protein HMPREF9103_01187 [Lentilactobacillus parafarraginis F0439]|uniref:Uncharacterized protein n=1 Tax=Lentilactobacillus parafarraginis F0439 TaxID=797515 RepID=G9ZN85_9LACO|nr:hypothetical protein HMPREF9103_01187 [Lentilactobacillus parafarraginis F0439]
MNGLITLVVKDVTIAVNAPPMMTPKPSADHIAAGDKFFKFFPHFINLHLNLVLLYLHQLY